MCLNVLAVVGYVSVAMLCAMCPCVCVCVESAFDHISAIILKLVYIGAQCQILIFASR